MIDPDTAERFAVALERIADAQDRIAGSLENISVDTSEILKTLDTASQPEPRRDYSGTGAMASAMAAGNVYIQPSNTPPFTTAIPASYYPPSSTSNTANPQAITAPIPGTYDPLANRLEELEKWAQENILRVKKK